MNLHDITPLIMTYNEAPNICRCLDRLAWARDIVIVDSFSTDRTLELAKRYPQVRIRQRRFDAHARQWNYGLKETGIKTEWVLGLDADYQVTEALVDELRRLRPEPEVSAYRVPFVYDILGEPLRGGVYPPVAVLFRRVVCDFTQDGHTHRLTVHEGDTHLLNSPIVHDDRKPFGRWLLSQSEYMKLEAQKLAVTPSCRLSFADRLRKRMLFAPFAVFVYCLVAKRGILDGRAGFYYALQRMTAEMILSLRLMENYLLSRRKKSGDSGI